MPLSSTALKAKVKKKSYQCYAKNDILLAGYAAAHPPRALLEDERQSISCILVDQHLACRIAGRSLFGHETHFKALIRRQLLRDPAFQ